MDDIRRFLVSIAVYAGTSALASAIPVLLLPVLTRWLTPGDFGIAGMFSVYVNAATALVGLGLNGALSVKYFDRTINFRAYVNACVWLVLGLFVVWCVVFLIGMPFWSGYLHVPWQWVLLALAAAAANSILLLRLSIWQAERRPWPFGLTRLTQAVLEVALAIALVTAFWSTWHGRTLSIAVALVIVGAISLYSLWRNQMLSTKVEWSAAKDAFWFGIPLLPHLLGGLVLSYVDRFLVSDLLGPERLGIYTVAAQIGLVLNLMSVSVNRAFAPWLMKLLEQKNPSSDRRIVQMTYAFFAVVALCVAALVWLSPLLVALLSAPAFSEASSILPWIVLGTGFTACYYAVTNYLFFANRTGWLSIGTVFSAILSVLFSVILIHTNGLIGAGQAFAAGQFVTFVITFGLAYRAHAMPWFRLK